MPSAIEQIVAAYVRLNNRRALEGMLMRWQRLAIGLKGRQGYDFSLPVGQIDEEISVIQAGLKRLATAAT